MLEVRNLVIEGKRGEIWAPIVDGIDFTLARGEVLGLIGESGAGKSTLGLAAMGYVRSGCRIARGSVRFDGLELTTLDQNELRALHGRRIAYVAQSAAAAFNPAHRLLEQTIETAVITGQMSRSEATARAHFLYEKLQLPDPTRIGNRYPHQVSGGQLQRAMTAMAMMCQPDLIVFDEPTTALDVTTQIEVLAAMRHAIRELGMAAIYISHDLAVVAQMAGKMIVLRHGKLVEAAPTPTMLSAPTEDYTKSLWAVRSFRSEPKPKPEKPVHGAIDVSGINAKYGTVRVLHDVNVSFKPGRIVAIVGESGSGKSTLARVISGLLPPETGRVSRHGDALPPNYSSRSKDQLRQIQFIYQSADTALNPRRRVRDIVGRPLSFYQGVTGKEKQQRIRQLLIDVELDPDKYLDVYPSTMSGGQKQRVGIARALAASPEFIICDEVTSALDQLVAEGVLKLLVKLQREKSLTYMFVTHDISTVRAIADDVVVMQSGRVVEQGVRDDVLDNPQEEYTKRLLSSVPDMDPEWLDRRLATTSV